MVVEQNRLGSLLSYVMDLLFAAVLSLMPRLLLEHMAKRCLRDVYKSELADIRFFKSARSALTALFEALLDEDPEAVVLLPDYICNVVYRAADHAGIGVRKYDTDQSFHPDVEQVQRLLADERAVAVLFASIMGTQNNGQRLLDDIRSVRPDVAVILDESQNLVRGSPMALDYRTAVLLSFNNKVTPGVLGGALAFSHGSWGLSSPRVGSYKLLLTELRIWSASVKQAGRRIQRCLTPWLRRAEQYPRPELEYSRCRRHYSVEVQPIAKLSLSRAFVGLLRLRQLELQRETNYEVFVSALRASAAGEIVHTDRPHLAPYMPIALENQEVFGFLPLKGPYATDDDPRVTLHPNLYAIENNGWITYDLSAEGCRFNV